jgi:two-component sensor histidine kinase
MTHGPSELARPRDAGQAGERQRTRDRAVIAPLQAELGNHRRETRHRILDILSIMRAIARRPAEEGETAELYPARLDSRLASFANLQGQLARMPRGGIDLYTMIDGELLPSIPRMRKVRFRTGRCRNR